MKTPTLNSLFILERDSKYRCFPVKFAKFLRALFFTEHLGGLLLQKTVLKNFSIFAEKY